MDLSKRNERRETLLIMGRELHKELMEVHKENGGDPDEIVFDEMVIDQIVAEYAVHLDDFKCFHEFEGDKLAENDKISGLTSILIMRFKPFSTKTNAVNTPVSAGQNQWFAIRWTDAVLGVRKPLPNHFRWFYHCFSHAIENDAAMHTWVVLCKKLYRWHGPADGSQEPMSDYV